jgi:uncharacterized protein
VERIFKILPFIYVAETADKGRGVFTSENIRKGTIVEVSPVIVMKQKEKKLLNETLMHDYIFEWGDTNRQCCVALGYVSLYNHSFDSNCEYEMEYDDELIRITTVKNIRKGEELFVNYNGTFNNKKPLWFDVK